MRSELLCQEGREDVRLQSSQSPALRVFWSIRCKTVLMLQD